MAGLQHFRSNKIYLRSTDEQTATHIGLSVQKSANIVDDVETANINRETAVEIET